MPSRQIHSRRTLTTIPTLSEQLQSIVPSCAQSCLSTYIHQGFDDGKTCSGSDLSCLCSTYSSYGMTLGELALTCLHISDCESEEEEQQRVFGICSAQSDAAQATLTVLKPPAVTPFSSSRTTSATSQPGTATTVTRMTTTPASELPTSTSSNVPAASPSSTSSSGSTGLTSAQAVGISIAAIGFVVLVIAFAYIVGCVRRRKYLKHAGESKHKDGCMNEKSAHKSWFDFHDPKGPHGVFTEPDGVQTFSKRQTAWPSPHAQHGYQQSHQEAAIAGRSVSRESCHTANSIRTVSRLLPEKPARIQPRPAQPARPRRPSAETVTIQTPATVFEEDRFSVLPRPVPSLPKNPRQPQYAHQFTKYPEVVPPPSLSLDIPRNVSRSQTIEAVMDFPPPSREATTRPFYGCSKAASSTNSFLNYYEGPDSGSPEDYYPYTPIDEHSQIRRPAPAAILITKPIFPPVAVRTSTASDNSRRTSFESTDPDEATPPDEADENDKRLSPVVEAESPIASIRYPKIPRGSNQAVPRSPEQRQYKSIEQWRHNSNVPLRTGERGDGRRVHAHNPASSSSSLAAKRVGDYAADSLERGLRITTTGAPSQERVKHPREHGDVPSTHSPANWPLPSQEPLKSPLWEPKLTPRRLGGDLYLSVSVATPTNPYFSER